MCMYIYMMAWNWRLRSWCPWTLADRRPQAVNDLTFLHPLALIRSFPSTRFASLRFVLPWTFYVSLFLISIIYVYAIPSILFYPCRYLYFLSSSSYHFIHFAVSSNQWTWRAKWMNKATVLWRSIVSYQNVAMKQNK